MNPTTRSRGQLARRHSLQKSQSLSRSKLATRRHAGYDGAFSQDDDEFDDDDDFDEVENDDDEQFRYDARYDDDDEEHRQRSKGSRQSREDRGSEQRQGSSVFGRLSLSSLVVNPSALLLRRQKKNGGDENIESDSGPQNPRTKSSKRRRKTKQEQMQQAQRELHHLMASPQPRPSYSSSSSYAMQSAEQRPALRSRGSTARSIASSNRGDRPLLGGMYFSDLVVIAFTYALNLFRTMGAAELLDVVLKGLAFAREYCALASRMSDLVLTSLKSVHTPRRVLRSLHSGQ